MGIAGMAAVTGLVASGNAVSGVRAAPRLERAAQEFEAQMMKELLRPMSTASAVPGEDEEESGGVLGEFASEALAGAMSAHGGLGMAKRIVADLSRSGNDSQTSTGNPEFAQEYRNKHS